MHGVIFGEKHTYRDWGLVLKDRPLISPPSPKMKMIQVPGSDKVIDLTQHLTGDVHYEPRTISFEFAMLAKRNRWASVYSEILNYLHGKSIRIIFDDDPVYFYTGRVTVGELEIAKETATLKMTAIVEPYKRERHGEGRRL